jgi:LCP family protein required for cell wall assembly
MEGRHTNKKDRSKKMIKKYKGLKLFGIAFSVCMILLGLLMFTNTGNKMLINIAGSYIYDKLEYEQIVKEKPVTNDSNKEPNKEIIKVNEDVINILLLGVEEFGGASNTDSIMIATINTKDNTMKLTSIMRDLYVSIPGYNNNRINSVYSKGGIDLLYKTINLNFGVQLDGYAKVGFDAFEKIVDIVGGVEISLTKKEAQYLNSTNYISESKYRNVVAGKQVVNGNQALGYCRVRKVSTGTESSDFGRTQRQRVVLNAIFDKVKSKNIIQLGLLMNDILTNVKIETDISKKQFTDIMAQGVNLNIKTLENKRIPSDGSFNNIKVKLGKYNQDVLEPKDWDVTRKEIRQFIYGDIAVTNK